MNQVAEKIETKRTPQVWIGCLAAYNNGKLFGEWVDIPSDPEELREEIKRVLSKSPEPMAEEWAFMDYSDVPSTFGENPDLDKLCEYAELFNEYGDAIYAFIECFGVDDLSKETFEDAFRGSWDNFDDFAYDEAELYLAEIEGNEFLKRYFDYESWSRDLFHDYHSEDIGGYCYVFSNY